MEGPHRELRAGFADGLRRDDADGDADFHTLAGREVDAVARGTDALLQFARQRAADLDGQLAVLVDLEAHGLVLVLDRFAVASRRRVGQLGHVAVLQRGDAPGGSLLNHATRLDEHLSRVGVGHRRKRHAADGPLADLFDDFAVADDSMEVHALGGAAVVTLDDDVLRDVHQTPRQVTRVGGSKRRVGQTLSGAVGRHEVLHHIQADVERRLDGEFVDEFVELVVHQAAHAGQLGQLLDAASRAADRDQRERVALLESLDDFFTDLVVGLAPELDQGFGHLVVGHRAAAEARGDAVRPAFGVGEDLLTSLRRVHVRDRHGDAVAERPLEAQLLQVVEELDRGTVADAAVALDDDLRDGLLGEDPTQEVVRVPHGVRQDAVEDELARRHFADDGLPLLLQSDQFANFVAVFVGHRLVLVLDARDGVAAIHLFARSEHGTAQPDLDGVVQMKRVTLVLGLVEEDDLVRIRIGVRHRVVLGVLEVQPFTLGEGLPAVLSNIRERVAAQNDVLHGRYGRATVCRREQVLRREH